MQNANTPQVLITPLKPALIMGVAAEAVAPSFLRRKKAQGKAQFEQRPDDTKP